MNNFAVKRTWPVIEGEDASKGIIPAISEGHMSAPALYATTDYSVFEQSPKERGKVLTARLRHKEELQRHYGPDWKNHLNVPARTMGTIFHNSF